MLIGDVVRGRCPLMGHARCNGDSATRGKHLRFVRRVDDLPLEDSTHAHERPEMPVLYGRRGQSPQRRPIRGGPREPRPRVAAARLPARRHARHQTQEHAGERARMPPGDRTSQADVPPLGALLRGITPSRRARAYAATRFAPSPSFSPASGPYGDRQVASRMAGRSHERPSFGQIPRSGGFG